MRAFFEHCERSQFFNDRNGEISKTNKSGELSSWKRVNLPLSININWNCLINQKRHTHLIWLHPEWLADVKFCFSGEDEKSYWRHESIKYKFFEKIVSIIKTSQKLFLRNIWLKTTIRGQNFGTTHNFSVCLRMFIERMINGSSCIWVFSLLTKNWAFETVDLRRVPKFWCCFFHFFL